MYLLGIHFIFSPPVSYGWWTGISPSRATFPGGPEGELVIMSAINCNSVPLDHLHPKNNCFILYSPETGVWPSNSPQTFSRTETPIAQKESIPTSQNKETQQTKQNISCEAEILQKWTKNVK